MFTKFALRKRPRFLVVALAATLLAAAAALLLVADSPPTFTAGLGQSAPTPSPTPSSTLSPTPSLTPSPTLSAQPGSPNGLTAAPGIVPDAPPGSVVVRWVPATTASLHLVYLVKADGTGGRYWQAADGAYATTITDLDIGQAYWFAVVAGRPGADGEPYQWSQWSNWAQATPVLPGLPPPPLRPQPTVTATAVAPGSSSNAPTRTPSPGSQSSGSSRYVEIEGIVTSINAEAGTFVAEVREHEYFGANPPPAQVTVDYNRVSFIANWISNGLYVEAEGSYDAASATLYAREVEREDRDDDDDDYDDDDDDDDDD